MTWLKIDDARRHAGSVSRGVLYRAVRAGKLRAARIGVGRNLLFHSEWIDAWLHDSARLDVEFTSPATTSINPQGGAR